MIVNRLMKDILFSLSRDEIARKWGENPTVLLSQDALHLYIIYYEEAIMLTAEENWERELFNLIAPSLIGYDYYKESLGLSFPLIILYGVFRSRDEYEEFANLRAVFPKDKKVVVKYFRYKNELIKFIEGNISEIGRETEREGSIYILISSTLTEREYKRREKSGRIERKVERSVCGVPIEHCMFAILLLTK